MRPRRRPKPAFAEGGDAIRSRAPVQQLLTVAEAEALAVHAEELGLDGVFVPDHIMAKPATTQHYGSHWPDSFSLLAYLAGRPRRRSL